MIVNKVKNVTSFAKFFQQSTLHISFLTSHVCFLIKDEALIDLEDHGD